MSRHHNINTTLKENKRKRVILSLFLLFFIIFLIYLFMVLQFQFLYIKDLRESEVTALFPLREEEEFTIRYTHSVDLLPIYEIYFSKDKHIYLRETHFYNFGAGMGLLEERGTYIEKNGMLKIRDINEKIEPFILRTGKVAKHQLLYREINFPLATYFGPDAKLNFELRNISVWTALRDLLLMCNKAQESGVRIEHSEYEKR